MGRENPPAYEAEYRHDRLLLSTERGGLSEGEMRPAGRTPIDLGERRWLKAPASEGPTPKDSKLRIPLLTGRLPMRLIALWKGEADPAK